MCSKERKLIWRKTLPVVIIAELLRSISAHVAELVDAHGSGPCAARCGGSSPSVGTTKFRKKAAAPLKRSAAFFIFTLFRCTPLTAVPPCGMMLPLLQNTQQ